MTRLNVREQILSAGLSTLRRKGFNATSVEDITEAADVPKGSFYNHFESKEALGAAAVLKYREESESLKALRALRRYEGGAADPVAEVFREPE